jgi:hypothetical protein
MTAARFRLIVHTRAHALQDKNRDTYMERERAGQKQRYIYGTREKGPDIPEDGPSTIRCGFYTESVWHGPLVAAGRSGEGAGHAEALRVQPFVCVEARVDVVDAP